MKIAHISDLHLRCRLPGTAANAARLSRAMPEKLAAALAQIRAEEPDLLVVTGDLLDYPLEDLDEPKRMAEGLEDLRLIAEMLERMRCPVTLVPGNHDHPDLFMEVFGAQPLDFTCAEYRVLAFLDEEQESNVPLREGVDYERFFNALLDAHTQPQIHVQHYVIWPILNEGYPHSYGDADAMTDAITGSGMVRLVLSGHYHAGVPLFQLGPAYFAVARAFCEAPHPFALYQIEGDRVTVQERQVRA